MSFQIPHVEISFSFYLFLPNLFKCLRRPLSPKVVYYYYTLRVHPILIDHIIIICVRHIFEEKKFIPHEIVSAHLR